MEKILDEIKKYGLTDANVSLIREKDGVTVARVRAGEASYIIKLFNEGVSSREIENYRILASLGVPTLRLFGSRERSLLMEDIEASPMLRLGTEGDMNDPEVVRSLAKWYRALHGRGEEYVRLHGGGMYDEWDMFTLENIDMIGERLGADCERAVSEMKKRFPELRSRMDTAGKTLCYNDFYYTNMAVCRDGSDALMFDYNLLGKGCYVNDLLNVTYWFSKENTELFLREYGGADAELMRLARRITPVISLVSALQRGIFPAWAEEAKRELIRNAELVE